MKHIRKIFAILCPVLSASAQLPDTLTQTLTPAAGAPGDLFGYSVAVSGTRVVVGAYGDDTGASAAGRVYVYDLAGANPTVPIATLDNPDPAQNDYFGFSVAISGTRIVVGTQNDDTKAVDAGSAYVYDLANDPLTTPIALHNPDNPEAAMHDGFGYSVAIFGRWVVVGAAQDDWVADNAGSAYVYDLENFTPTEPIARLHNPHPATGDSFGVSVAISGAHVVVGAHRDGAGADPDGRVYVYPLGTITTPVETPINNPSPAADDYFGRSVAISGDRLIVGAYGDDTLENSAGSAYVYNLAGTSPTLTTTLTYPEPGPADSFGSSVAISGTRVIVGAFFDDTSASDAGSAYVYDLASATPASPVKTLNNPALGANDEFATSVAIDGTTVIIGAPNHDSPQDNKGSAYVFGPAPAPEIAVRDPFGADVPNGGGRDFGAVAMGSNASLTFTIRNTGTASLNGLVLSKDGPDAALFTITGPPAPFVIGPNGSATFDVRFAPTTAGLKSATIRIASNDANENPFEIAVTGTGLSNNANLSNLVINPGTLTPAFAPGTTTYTAGVSSGVTSLTVTPTTADPGATVKVNGVTVASGVAIGLPNLNVGPNTITTVVTAADGTTTKTYSLTVTRAAPVPEIVVEQPSGTNVADVGSRSFGSVAVGSNSSLVFTIRNTGTASLTGLGITKDGPNEAMFTITGPLTPPPPISGSGGSATFTIQFEPTSPGPKTATIHIASNDADENPFDITLTGTGLSNNANLSNLVLSAGMLNPPFAPGTTSYSANVSTQTTSITVTPTTADAGATVKVNGVTVDPGTTSGNLNLNVGQNPITTVVTAADGTTTKSYTVTVTRAAPVPEIAVEQPLGVDVPNGGTKVFGSVAVGSNASLIFTIRNTGTASLSVSNITKSGPDAGMFTISGMTFPSVIVPGGSATFTVNFAPASSGPKTANIHIASDDANENPFSIELSGTGLSNNANLSNLVLSAGTLSPTFAPGTTDYSAQVPYEVSSVTVTPTTADPGATVRVNVEPVTSGTPSSPVSLQVDRNDIAILVTAADGITTKTYIVWIRRFEPIPEVAIEEPSGTDVPDGGSRSFGTVPVGLNASLTFNVRNTGTDFLYLQNITIDGPHAAMFSITSPPTLPLVVSAGGSTILTVRFAPTSAGPKSATLRIDNNDVDENPFDITLTAGAGSNNANLSNLTLDLSPLNPAFAPGTTAYSANVSSGITAIRMLFTTADPGATVKVNGVPIASGDPFGFFQILRFGSNPIAANVTSPDGSTVKTYIVTVNRDATLPVPLPGGRDLSFTADISFPGPSYGAAVTAVQRGSHIYVGGPFTQVNFAARKYVAKLNFNGSILSEFNQALDGPVTCLALLEDELLIGGAFTLGSATDGRLIAVDPTFGGFGSVHSGVGYGPVNCTALQPDTRIVIGGDFTAVNGNVLRNRIARLEFHPWYLEADLAFNPNVNGPVHTAAIQPDGKIVIGGDFSTVGGTERHNIARIRADGSVDPTFEVWPVVNIECIALQPDWKILVNGHLRLNPDGTVDSGFTQDRGVVRSMALQVDGKVIAGGYSLGNDSRRNLVRFNADGTVDTTFNADLDGGVHGVTLDSRGGILITGEFSRAGGAYSKGIARLHNPGATEILRPTGSGRVEWLRAGPAPEVQYVEFEISTNGGASWSRLGAASRIAGGWELTGLNLPASGELRAMARIIGGFRNGSSSWTDFGRSGFGPDTDNDGLLNSWELTYWPTTVGHDADDDFDGDGVPELQEMAFGLNPTVPDSAMAPRFVNEGGFFTITITKRPGVAYEVQSGTTTNSAAFSSAGITVLINNATTLKARDSFPVGTQGRRFLRVRVTPAP